MEANEIDTRFHAVYLLTSSDPKYSNWYYIGYTVDPLRRLRQHNGELNNGAWRTSRRGRPWRLVLCVSGFSEDRSALKFEWTWQNPSKALITRDAVRVQLIDNPRGRPTRLHFAVGVLHILLRTAPFSHMALSLNIIDRETYYNVTSSIERFEVPFPVASPLLVIREYSPEALAQKILQEGGTLAPVDDDNTSEVDYDAIVSMEAGLVPCTFCGLAVTFGTSVRCPGRLCHLRAHIPCMAMWFFSEKSQPKATQPNPEPPQLIPTWAISCPTCGQELHWGVLAKSVKQKLSEQTNRLLAQRKKELQAVGPQKKKHRQDPPKASTSVAETQLSITEVLANNERTLNEIDSMLLM